MFNSNTWNHLTVCKQMAAIKLFLLNCDTWNHLTACKEMSTSDSFKHKVTYNLLMSPLPPPPYHIYIYIYIVGGYVEKWINRNTDNEFKSDISSLFQRDFLPLFHFFFFHMSDFPNLPFLTIYIYMYIYVYIYIYMCVCVCVCVNRIWH